MGKALECNMFCFGSNANHQGIAERDFLAVEACSDSQYMCSLAALDREAPAHEAVTDGEGRRWKHAELQRPLQTESGTAALGCSLFPMACAASTAAPLQRQSVHSTASLSHLAVP